MKFISTCGLVVCATLIFAKTFAEDFEAEIYLENMANQYRVASLAKEGIVILYESAETDQGLYRKWIFRGFDSLLYEKWYAEFPIGIGSNLVSHKVVDKNIVLLFQADSKLQLLKIESHTGLITHLDVSSKFNQFDVEDIAVLGNDIFIGGNIPPSDNKLFMRSAAGYLFFPLLFIPGYIPQRNAALIYSSFESKKCKDIDFPYKGFSTVTQILPDSQKSRAHVIIKNTVSNESRVIIHEYRESGSRARTYEIRPLTIKYSLNEAKMLPAEKNTQILVGTYAYNRKNGSQGLYFTVLKNEDQKYINYLSFTKFKHFFDHLDSSKKSKLYQKISKKHAKDKDLKIEYYIDLHEIYPDSSQYIIVGEVYEPRYHTEYRIVWYYGRPVEQPYLVFDGWNYTHAFVANINANGQLVWDYFIDMQDLTFANMYKRIHYFKKNKAHYFAYLSQGKLVASKIENNVMSTENNNMLNSKNTGNELEETIRFHKIEPLYGNNFLLYGLRTAKAEDGSLKKYLIMKKESVKM